MRSSGLVEAARGFDTQDHLCWLADGPADARTAMLEFLVDGLELGQRVRYVANAPREALIRHVTEIPGGHDALAQGRLEVTSLFESYRDGAVVTPAAQVSAYAELTEDSLAAGFTGLRVAADATALVRTAAQRDAFGRYEHLVDRYMTTHPFSAMCAYDTDELGEDAAREIACMHPAVRGPVPFRLHAADQAHVVSLAGEVDVDSAALLSLALDRAEPVVRGGEVVIDARELEFIDHHGLLALADFARDADATVVLRTTSRSPHRLVEALELDRIRVETAA